MNRRNLLVVSLLAALTLTLVGCEKAPEVTAGQKAALSRPANPAGGGAVQRTNPGGGKAGGGAGASAGQVD